jgi:hypothetical protein
MRTPILKAPERGAMIVHDYDEVEFKCECGKEVKLRRRVSHRSVTYVILCDGSIYRGHASKYAIFRNRGVQDFCVSHHGASIYVLYHLDEELSMFVKVSKALHITLAQAAYDLKHLSRLNRFPLRRRGCIAFLVEHPELRIRQALKTWKLMNQTELELLGGKKSTHDH